MSMAMLHMWSLNLLVKISLQPWPTKLKITHFCSKEKEHVKEYANLGNEACMLLPVYEHNMLF